MFTDVASILEELRQDHRNMAVLLDLLEAESELVSGDDDPDLELLADIMRYMTVYSDAVHHPREDVVYAAMREHSAKLAEGLEDVVDDHRDIATLGAALRADVEAANAGSAVPRQRLLRDMRGYVDRLRTHMRWEEDDLFRRADTLAQENAGAKIDITGLVGKDPVFGATAARSFASLTRRLRSSRP